MRQHGHNQISQRHPREPTVKSTDLGAVPISWCGCRCDRAPDAATAQADGPPKLHIAETIERMADHQRAGRKPTKMKPAVKPKNMSAAGPSRSGTKNCAKTLRLAAFRLGELPLHLSRPASFLTRRIGMDDSIDATPVILVVLSSETSHTPPGLARRSEVGIRIEAGRHSSIVDCDALPVGDPGHVNDAVEDGFVV